MSETEIQEEKKPKLEINKGVELVTQKINKRFTNGLGYSSTPKKRIV